ncbi:hypothetical protein EYA84_13245 [Verrucosispora sp. SN26_14.1]|uniref:EsaB/YukD family protein n=1 Tax=Verrucosispora sp. SN26_14.1 TaxID=2527879 RepID=UPI001034A9EF|nr:EsaB/YukD family protein [Verrucosispora sp. SN26_14.1]TBL35878.1 hypothetical protein EYA84_13245 [Verrucosispora sp. SN26_14.1]
MSGERSRITVVGTRRRLDVSVPSGAPVGEYSARLAEMCGQDRADVLPPAWSLAPAGHPPLPLDATLLDVGVVDGQVLYLRDAAQEPNDAPLVEEIEELVADKTHRHRQQRLRGGTIVLSLGLLWTTVAAITAGLRFEGGAGTAAGLVLAGLGLLAGAWSLTQHREVVPDWLRMAVALTSVPCLAAAGMLVTRVLGVTAYRWDGAVFGACLAALMALVVIPTAALVVVQLHLTVGLALVSLIRALDTDRAGAAAVVTVTAMGIIAVARRIAATVASWGQRRPPDQSAALPVTIGLVDRSHRLLSVVLVGPALALTAALPVLASNGGGWAVALTAVASIALMARCRLVAFSAELLLLGIAALVGCFSLILAVVGMLGAGPGATLVVLVLAGLGVAGAGVTLSLLRPSTPEPPRDGPMVHPSARRRSRAEVFGVITSLLMVPLALGVLGAFRHMVEVGRSIF